MAKFDFRFACCSLAFLTFASCSQTESLSLCEFAAKGDLPAIRTHLLEGPSRERVTQALWSALQSDIACERKFSIAQLLIESGAQVDAPNDRGYTSLHMVASSDCLTLVKLILKHSSDINAPNDASGVTPLHLACQADRPDVVRLFLENNADVCVKDNTGRLPIHFVSGASTECIKQLLSRTPEKQVNVLDEFGMSPVLYVISGSKKTDVSRDTIRLLIAAGADVTVPFSGPPLPDSALGERSVMDNVPALGESPVEFAERIGISIF